MRIAACIKRVPITGGRILLTDDARAINTQHLGFTISPHEECGVEEAVRLIEANKGDSVVLTLGPSEAVEQLRDAMALGIDRAIHLQTDGQEWDAEATAGALLEAIRADESANGPFDIIFFGNESADSGGFQVGIRVAYGLGRPCVTGLKKVTLEGSQVRCEQQVEGGRDVYVVPLPAVLTVKEGLNLPRYPSVPGKMRARSKPVAVVTPSRPAPPPELVKLAATPGDPVEVTRLRWGGSLLEEARLHSARPLITVAPHTVAADDGPVPPEVDLHHPHDRDMTVRVSDHVEPSSAGVSLAAAKVIVSGGRGVGSKEGFAIIEELAALLGAAVGCSRAVTSAGWRPHTDQVGQTGTKVAPEVYIACGISGATQHMAGLKGAKRIVAINSDPQAPLMLNADYTVTGDLKEIVPAISAEIRRRR